MADSRIRPAHRLVGLSHLDGIGGALRLAFGRSQGVASSGGAKGPLAGNQAPVCSIADPPLAGLLVASFWIEEAFTDAPNHCGSRL